jgi:putative salt-induced outer membrane protein
MRVTLPLVLPLMFTLAWSTTAAAQTTPAPAKPAAPAPAPAPAPADPAETVKAQTATKGTTDLAKGGFVTSAAPKDDDPRVVNDVSLGLGGLFSAGNARTIAVTTLGRMRFRRDEHQATFAGTGNYARAGKKGEPIDTTVENFQGLLRYDYYLTNEVSLFLQSTARRDKFQGLDLRLNVDPGVAYYFINTKTHRLQIEGGYDLQHDIRRNESRAQPVPAGSPPGTPPPPPVDKTKTLHNARIFLGYENKLRKEVSLITSVEYLQNFADIETYRFIADIGLKSNIADSLALATTYTARYENKPLPTVADLDSIASVNLVYTFF